MREIEGSEEREDRDGSWLRSVLVAAFLGMVLAAVVMCIHSVTP